jgi:hypothetical protein
MSAGLSQAQWSVYGDHELRAYLIAYPHLSIGDIPSLLSKTVAGYPGKLTRYNPINYVFYASEALAWGNNYFFLNTARIAGFCIFSVFLFLGLCRFFPALVACALGALCLIGTYWKFVWIGFSTNEQYIALLGIPFTWTYVRLYWHARRGNSDMPISWVTCLAFAALLAGTKEPMLITAPAVVVLLGVSLYHEARFDYRVLASGIALALMFVIAVTIGVGLFAHGSVDFYGNSLAPTERLLKILAGLRHYPFPLLIALAIVSFGLSRAAKKIPEMEDTLRTINVAVQFQFWLLLVSLSLMLFYDGWPAGNRYMFPGELIVFVSFLIPLFIFGQIVKASRPKFWIPYQVAIFVLAVSMVAWRGYRDFRSEAAAYVARSQTFTASIFKVAAQAKSMPNAQIVVEAISPYDLEPIFSVNRFLVSLGVTNPMFVRTHELSAGVYPKTSFFQGLIDTIKAVSEQGSITYDTGVGVLPSPFLINYKPFSNFSPSSPCLSVRLKEAPYDGCAPISTITY